MDDSSEKKLGTRVFKKSSSSNKITIYIGKRDFLEKNGVVEPIDGIVQVDPEYFKDRKVFVHVLAAFHYGREDLDVLGLSFQKDLYLSTQQVYPTETPYEPELTKLQDRLVKKIGENAKPFFFQLPFHSPASVSLQPALEHNGKPCGVEYELKVYVVDNQSGTFHKRNSVRLMIRKLTYAAPDLTPPPSEETVKEFKMGNGRIRLEANLDKSKYFHGESISVNIVIDNTSSKTVKKLRVQAVQFAEIMLYSKAIYKTVVDETESDDSCPIPPGQMGWCKTYHLCPLLSNNRDKLGIAVDGKLRYEDTNLASSTMLDENADVDNLGIIVSYKIRVRLLMGFGASDIQLEVPFTLTHPNSEVDAVIPELIPPNTTNATNYVDTSLISTDFFHDKDDELIFEDFARLRLRQQENSCDEA